MEGVRKVPVIHMRHPGCTGLTHIHLSQLLLVLGTPVERLLDVPVEQALSHPVHLLERVDVHQVADALVLSKGPRALAIALPHEVVDQQPVEPLPRPVLVLDVLEGVHVSQVRQVLNPGADLAIQPGLLLFTAFQLPLNAAHAGDHGVEVAEDIVGAGATLEGSIGGVLELLLDEGALFLDDEMGRAKVLVEELVWEAQEGLVLA